MQDACGTVGDVREPEKEAVHLPAFEYSNADVRQKAIHHGLTAYHFTDQLPAAVTATQHQHSSNHALVRAMQHRLLTVPRLLSFLSPP